MQFFIGPKYFYNAENCSSNKHYNLPKKHIQDGLPKKNNTTNIYPWRTRTSVGWSSTKATQELDTDIQEEFLWGISKYIPY